MLYFLSNLLPHTKSQQQVRFEHRIIGGHRAVHSQHAQVAFVLGRDCADAHQGLHYRDTRGFHECLELARATVAPAAHVPGGFEKEGDWRRRKKKVKGDRRQKEVMCKAEEYYFSTLF